ncbi:MAG: SBBP repeat-containing protein [Leptospiraceae bacterium]|nr:SBBP repeat-containing protein [Leptospiraceae bacterium]MCP5493417.1 SBBP repeat-containing protein [Leptospiraceae bacterium]
MKKYLWIVYILIFIAIFACKKDEKKNWLWLALLEQSTSEVATVEIQGQITDTSGNPYSEASLSVAKEATTSIQSRGATVTGTTKTDTKGNFTLYLNIGKYKISVYKSDGTLIGSFVLQPQNLTNKHISEADVSGLLITLTEAVAIGSNVNLLSANFSFSAFTNLIGVSGATIYQNAVATDSVGNIYTTGASTVSLDGNTVTGTSDVTIHKYDKKGIRKWTKLLGVASLMSYGYGITTDSLGNVYVTGFTDTGGGLDGNPTIGAQDGFVAKYNSSGSKKWVKAIGVASAYTTANDVAIDSSGNIYVVGYTTGNLDGNTAAGTKDLFVMKYDTNGNRKWTKLLGVSGQDTSGNDIAIDSSDNLYVTGATKGNLDGNTKTGTQDMFVSKYDSSGNRQWTKLLGGSGADTSGSGITINSSDSAIYISGTTSVSLDGQTFNGGGTQYSDAFVAKYDSSGNRDTTFTKQVGVNGTITQGQEITVDSSENVYIIGNTKGSLLGNTLTGVQDIFVIKYNSSGTYKGIKLMGITGSGSSYGLGITLDSYGTPVAVGWIQATATVGGSFDNIPALGTNANGFITTKLKP